MRELSRLSRSEYKLMVVLPIQTNVEYWNLFVKDYNLSEESYLTGMQAEYMPGSECAKPVEEAAMAFEGDSGDARQVEKYKEMRLRVAGMEEIWICIENRYKYKNKAKGSSE